MPFTAKSCENFSILDQLSPVSQSAATVTGAACDTLYFNRMIFIIQMGVMSASSTVDAKLQSNPVASGGTWTDISGSSITQVTQAVNGNNNTIKLGLNCEAVGQNSPAGRYVRLRIVVGTAATLLSYLAIGFVGRWKPENKFNEIAAVLQTVDVT